MKTHWCYLESSFDGVEVKGSIPRSWKYHVVPIKIEFLVYCKSNEKLCASSHNLSLLLEKQCVIIQALCLFMITFKEVIKW